MAKESAQNNSFLPEDGSNPAENSFDYKPSLFLLNPGIYFATGTRNGALYDTNTENVYSLNELGVRAVLGKPDYSGFKENLALELGIEKLDKPTIESRDTPSIELEFVWFEIISDDCNERCIHCYVDSMPPTYRRNFERQIQSPDLNGKKKLTAEQWKNLIEESFVLGCRQCQFIGGEPFIWRGENGETVLDLAQQARNSGFETVEIFTNATLITESSIKRIKDLGLRIAVSLYSSDEKTHDAITRTRGSFRKTMQALELLKKAGISTRVETVLMKQNQDTVEDTDRMIQEMGFNHRSPDVLRPRGRGDNPDLYPDSKIAMKYSLRMEPNFSAKPEFVRRNFNMHSCLAGKIAITDTGDLLPCIFSRGEVAGNVVKDGSIENVLKGEIQELWGITKDDVLVCRDCEYRYVCFDCRPISEGVNEGRGKYKTAPYPRCTYNPYEGEWGKGTWKLDEEGEPFYDTTLIEIIPR